MRGDLWFMSYCGNANGVNPTLPSWVADWSHKYGFTPFCHMRTLRGSPSLDTFAKFTLIKKDSPLF
jgi:hypothetical protein